MKFDANARGAIVHYISFFEREKRVNKLGNYFNHGGVPRVAKHIYTFAGGTFKAREMFLNVGIITAITWTMCIRIQSARNQQSMWIR